MKKNIIFCLILFLSILSVPNGFCDDTEKEEKVAAVQERIFFKYHEIDFDLGYISDDDFHHSFPIGLGYTFNFNDHIAWNVADAKMMLNVEKDLKKDLEEDFGAAPSQFSELKYTFHSNFLLKPLYGKDVYKNQKVINHETYFLIGGGLVAYEKKFSNGKTDSEIAPSISFGIGKKIFLSQKLCMNIELKDWVNFREGDVENNFWLGIGLGYRFNLSARKTVNDETLDKLEKYLKRSE